MPAVILGIAGLAASVGGGVMGAQGSANSAKAQATQGEVNRKWQEFEKEWANQQQRGQMGIAEMDRLLINSKIEDESLANMLSSQRAARDAFEYSTNQFSRNYRQTKAALTAGSASRGMARGGTADALKNQMAINTASDQIRIKQNFNNQMDMFENKRNQELSQRNLRPSTEPPMYMPSAPIPMPDTSGMMTGAILGAIGQGLGGAAGIAAGTQSTQSTPTTAPGGVPFSTVAALNLGG